MGKIINVTLGIDISYNIMESILLLKPLTSKEDVLRIAQTMAKVSRDNPAYSDDVKESYIKAFEMLQELEFEDMQEIVKIIRARKTN